MTFSIIVPIHNGEKYIDDMMDPIIAQDVTIVGKVKGVFRYFN